MSMNNISVVPINAENQKSPYIMYIYTYLMAAATAADPKESHHGFVEGTGRYGRAASSRSAGLEPRC